MKRIFLFGLLAALSFTSLSTTNSSENDFIASYRVQGLSSEALNQVAENFEIYNRLGENDFAVYVLHSKRNQFLAIAPKAELLDDGTTLSFSADLLGEYRTYENVVTELTQLEASYPALVKTFDYGTSTAGRRLMGVKISDNVTADEDEPELLVTSATHGDEIITVEVTMELMNELVEQYGTNQRLKKIVDENEIFFIPMVNVDGFVLRRRYVDGVDPNRQYPWPEQPERNPVSCIRDLIAFFHSHNFVGTLDFHATGGMVMFPWAYTKDHIDQADHEQMNALTTYMAEKNSFRHGPIATTIYVAKGSSADYYYWKNKSIAIAIEIGQAKAPKTPFIPVAIDENRESLWRFLEAF